MYNIIPPNIMVFHNGNQVTYKYNRSFLMEKNYTIRRYEFKIQYCFTRTIYGCRGRQTKTQNRAISHTPSSLSLSHLATKTVKLEFAMRQQPKCGPRASSVPLSISHDFPTVCPVSDRRWIYVINSRNTIQWRSGIPFEDRLSFHSSSSSLYLALFCAPTMCKYMKGPFGCCRLLVFICVRTACFGKTLTLPHPWHIVFDI